MKLNKLYLFFITLGFLSCSEEFTELSPISKRNAASFYGTASDMQVSLNAVYSSLKSNGCYSQSLWILQELRSDNTQWTGSGLAEEITVFDVFNEIPTSPIASDAWIDLYLGVSRANIVINRIEKIDIDPASKNQILGEALFLRSLFYYNLAVAFGNIPLVLTETASVEEAQNHTQVDASVIYAQISEDLVLAEQNLPKSYSNSSDLGRATKGAASALLGKVYLTMGDKAMAKTALGNVSGYSLVSDYNNLWGEENEYNSESIFEVDYKGGLGNQGQSFTNQFNGILSQAVTSGLRNYPERDLIAAYETGDKRLAASIEGTTSEAEGWTIKFGKTNSSADDDAGTNWPVLRYADVLLMLAEATGESAEAYGYINQVRSRAGLAAIDASTPGSFNEKLLQERRVELAFENHRWADLLRFNVVDAKMSAIGKPTRGKLLYPIPQREMNLNSNFIQNPGH